MKLTTLLAAALLLAACASGGNSTTTGPPTSNGPSTTTGSPTSNGSPLDQLISDLNGGGLEVEEADSFSSEPLGGDGRLLCAGDEELRVYLFNSEDDASTVAARIDPADPSNVGTAIVEWVGTPRFWQRGPMLVLYLGEDQGTEDALMAVLGVPFAQGAGPGRGPGGLPSPCMGS